MLEISQYFAVNMHQSKPNANKKSIKKVAKDFVYVYICLYSV